MRNASPVRPRADDGRRRLLVLDDADAAEDERAHDRLGDVRLGDQQAAKLGAARADHLAGRRHAAADEVLAVAEQVELAGELMLAPVVVKTVGPDGDGSKISIVPSMTMKKSTRAVAAIEQHRAARHGLHHAELRGALDLLVGQHREGLRPAQVGVGGIHGRVRRRVGAELGIHGGTV